MKNIEKENDVYEPSDDDEAPNLLEIARLEEEKKNKKVTEVRKESVEEVK